MDPATEMLRGEGKRGGRYAFVRVFLQPVVVDRHDAHEGRTLVSERDFEKIAHDLHGVAREQAMWSVELLAEVQLKCPLNSVLSGTGDDRPRGEPAVLGTCGVGERILLSSPGRGRIAPQYLLPRPTQSGHVAHRFNRAKAVVKYLQVVHCARPPAPCTVWLGRGETEWQETSRIERLFVRAPSTRRCRSAVSAISSGSSLSRMAVAGCWTGP